MTTQAAGASPVECSVERQVQERTLFEAYVKTLGYSVDPDTREGRAGGYWSSHTQLMWGAWRAAVAAERERCAKIAVKYGSADHCTAQQIAREILGA